MELVTPGLGLFFWMMLSFLLVVYILGKFAWKPIMKSLKDRSAKIQDALDSAEKAHQEMLALQVNNEKLLQDAKDQRDALLNDARKLQSKMMDDAKVKANDEANRIIEAARQSINSEKLAAINDLKNQVAILSIEIAEKIIQQKLSSDTQQSNLVKTLLANVKFN